MIRKPLLALVLLASFTGGVYHRELVAQPLDAPAAKFLATVAAEQNAAREDKPRGTFQAPVYEPSVTVPVGGLAMLDVPGIKPDKLDVAIIGGSYHWDGREVVYTPKTPRPRLLFDGLSNQPLLLVPTNEEFRGTYHIILVGGETLRIIPLTIGTGIAPAPPGPITPPGPVTPPVDPPPVVVPSKVTHLTFVYEKDQHAIPAAVMAGLNRVNRELGIIAVALDVDVTTGLGKIPEPYKLPFAAAKEAGLPALVASGGGKVIRVVKAPKTETEIMDAAK